MKSIPYCFSRQVVAAAILAAGIGTPINGQTIWTAGSGTDFNWSTTGNWSTGVPSLTDDVVFGSPVPNPGPLLNPTLINLISGSQAASLWMRDNHELVGGSLELASGGIRVDFGHLVTIDSVLEGTSGLTVSGGGSVRLGNTANTYTGVTSIANGSLIISGAGALGASTDAVIISDVNPVIGSNSVVGFSGGSLVLDGSAGGFTLARDIHLQGSGPASDRSGALVSIGDNTLAGALRMADGVSARTSRVISNNGTLTIAGSLNVAGAAGTHISSLGGVNTAGAGGNFILTGELTGSGTLNKQGAGTLTLTPSLTSNFNGRLRISGSATGGQSSVRVFSADVFGTANATNAAGPIDMNGGLLEIRSDSSLNIGKNVYNRATSTYFFGPAIGGSAVNGNVTFGTLRAAANTTATFNSRNGYGATFGLQSMESSNNNSTFTNNMGGLLTFTSNFWNNSDGSARTLTIGGSGNTRIEGNINTSGAGIKTLTKTGNGVLTLNGTATTLNGNLNISGGAVAIRDFRSINNNSNGVINIGSGTTAGALIIGTDAVASAGGLVTNRTLNLASTTGGASLYANQSGLNPVVLNGAFTTTGGAATNSKLLTLGGTNRADNIIHGNISNQAVSTTGVVSVLKTGPGTWVLAGANGYTGTTTISNGTLKLQANAAVSTVMPGTNAISFNNNNVYGGGTLEFVGQAGVDNVQNLGTLSYSGGGAATIKVTPGVGGTASLTFANISTGGGGTVNIVGADFLKNKVTFTQINAVAGSNGILTRSVYWNGADFAFREGGILRAPVYGVDVGTVTSDSALSSGNNQITGSFSTNTISVSTLKIAGSQTLTVNEAQTLTLSGGGLLTTGGNSTVTGGTLALGSGVLVARVDLGSDTLGIESAITGTGGLTKVGAGTLILSGNNTRTGTTSIHEGMLQLSGSGTLSGANAALTIRQGAALDLNGVSTGTSVAAFNNNGVVTNSSASAVTFRVGNNNGTGTSFGTIEDGGGIINVTKVGTGAQSWLGQSTYTGVTTIGSTGLVTVDSLADGGIASGIGASSSDAANLVFDGSTGGLSYRGNLVNGILNLGSTSATTDRLFTVSGSGVTLGSSPTTNLNNAIVWSNTGAIVHGTDANRTFTFTGTSQGDNSFNPQLTDSTGFATSVTKTGTGIWRLGNSDNTYSGATTITQGILMATDGQGLSSNSNLVFDGGALYSQGVLNRNIGTGPGEMQFATPAANTAQFAGGFMGGDEKLTVTWAGTPIWGDTPGFLDNRNGLILNGSQARGQGATGSIALSEVEIAGDFSLGSVAGVVSTPTVTTVNANATITFTTGTTAGLRVGQSITGTNIASGAYIISIISATQITVSANSSAAGTGIAATVLENTLRPIRVDDNGNTGADFASVSGNISAGDALTGIRKLGGGNLRLTGDNTYAGETNLYQGTLSILSLGHSSDAPNTPTSVGVSGVPFNDSNAITMGNGGTGAGILQYLGAGETSDRKIRLNTTTGSNQIHADGSGPLILTNVVNDVITATGNKILFLRGNNTQGNMVTSQLSDNGGTLSVAVDGGATWILTNPLNDYTGLTTAGGGALGIGHDTAIGGTLRMSNGSVFAYGGDRTIANPIEQTNNTTGAFIGNYSLNFTSAYALLSTTSNPSVTTNNIAAGKTLTFGGVTANTITANRTWTIEGNGEMIIDGDITTTTAFGLPIIKTGDGILQLNGIGSNFNQNNANLDIDRGTLRLGASEVISHGAGFGGLLISPELANGDTATLDLNGFSQTVNALTSTTDGTSIIDNTSASPSTLTFGANDAAANFGTGAGTYNITNSGGGALSLVKTGSGIATLGGGLGTTTLSYTGATTVEGGVLNIAAGLSSTTGINLAGGATLNLFNGVADDLTGLTSLSLGLGAGVATLGMELGADTSSSDRLVIAGAATTANTVQLDIRSLVGFGTSPTYDLIAAGSGLDGATYTLNNVPGGFTYVLNTSGTLVQLGVTALAAGDLFWQGDLSGSWSQLSGSNSNFSTDLAGTLDAVASPGVANTVVFSSTAAAGPSIATTLDNHYFVNALQFTGNPAGVTAVSIAPGTSANNTLTITPSSPISGIEVGDNAGAVTISAPVALGADQTWNIAGTGANGSSLTVSGAVSGSANLIKSGDGLLTLTANNDLYLGETTINGGILSIGGGGATGAIGPGDVVNNGVLRYNRTGTFTVPNLISGTGALEKSASGFMTLANVNNSFSGDITINAGTLAFTTVSNVGGPASSLGQGDAINMTGGTLRFVGDTDSQSTNRPIVTSVGNAVLSLGGTNGATMTFEGPITVGVESSGNRLTLTGTAGSEGFITGGFTMTGNAADGVVSGGTWTLSGAQNTVADNLAVTGTSTILNLNDTSILRFLSGAASGDIYINNGSTVNIGAENAIDMTIPYRLFIAQNAGGAPGILNLGTHNLTSGRFILGERANDRSGFVNGTGTLTVSDGDFDLYEGEINANLASAGTLAFEKFGPGTVTLRGDNSGLNSTGLTLVNEGLLVLDYTQSNTTKMRTASDLRMVGGNLHLIGNNSEATSQNVSRLDLDSGGSSVIRLQAGDSGNQDLVLNFTTIVRPASDGTVRFELPSGVQSATNGITTTNANNVTTGLLGSTTANSAAFATVKDGTGTWFATRAGVDNNIVGLVSTLTNDVSAWVNDSHVTDGTTGYFGALSASRLHSLRFDASVGSTVSVAPTGVLSIASGGILVTDQVTAGAPGIFGGTLVGGGASTATGPIELVIFQDSSQIFSITSDITRDTAISKNGEGILLLAGNNKYTGQTRVEAGTLMVSGGNAIGDTSLVTLAANRNTTLQLAADETIGRLQGGKRATNSEYGTVAVGAHTLTINQSASTTFAGMFTGTGSIVMNTGSTGNLNMQNNSTGFTGTVVVNGGLFQLSNIGRNDASSFTINGPGMMLIDNNGTTSSTTRILDTSSIILNSAVGSATNPRGLWVRNTDNNSSRFETIGNLVFNSGASYLTGEANVGSGNGRAGVIASNFVRSENATVSVRGRNLGTTEIHHNQFRIATANEAGFIAGLIGDGGAAGTTTQSIVPWAIGESHNNTTTTASNMGNSLVTYEAARGFRPLNLLTEYASYATAAAADNVRESFFVDVAGLPGKTVNSLVLHQDLYSNSSLSITGLGAGQQLVNTSGAFLFTIGDSTGATVTTTVGGFDDGIVVGGSEYAMFVVNPNAAVNSSVNQVVVNSPLVSAADLTKSGRGTLVLNGVNIAGGDANKTTINEGILEISALDNIGGDVGGLVFAGGTLRLGAGLTDDISLRSISFLTGGGTIDTNGVDLTLANSLGSGGGSFAKVGAGNLTLNAASTLTGSTTVTNGVLTLGASNAIGTGDLSVLAGATLDIGANDISVSRLITSGLSPAISGTGMITSTQGFAFTNTGNITVSAALAGSGGLLKTQTTVLTLDGASSYSGITEVQNGTLSFNSISNVAGASSALGTPFSAQNGMIRMGLTTAATTLTYTGIGHDSDRVIGMQGTTGGLTINADGTGGVSFGRVTGLVAGAKTLTLTGTADAALVNAIAGVVEGAATLAVVKNGLTTWSITGPGTHSGLTTVNAGVLNIRDGKALGSSGQGTTVVANATLQLEGGITVDDEALSVAGIGAAGQSGALVNLSGENVFGGAITLSAGATFAADNGSLEFLSAVSGFGDDLTVAGVGELIFTGDLALNTGRLIQNGAGVTTLAGNNTMTGGVLLNAGTVALGSAGAVGDLGDIQIAGGTLQFLAGGEVDVSGRLLLGVGSDYLIDAATGADVTFASALSGTGGLIKTGDGTLSLTAANTFEGLVTISAGKLGLIDQSGLGASPLVANLAHVTFDGGTLLASASFTLDDLNRGLTLGVAGGTFEVVESETLTVASILNGPGNFAKTGLGTLLFTTPAAYLGSTTILGGTLALGVDNAIPATDLILGSGGALDVGGFTLNVASLQVGGDGASISGTGAINSTAGFDLSPAGDAVIGANLSGTGALTKSGEGTAILTGANSYTGGTTISEGALFVTGSLASGLVDVQAGTVLGGTGTIAGDVSLLGTVTDPAILRPGAPLISSGIDLLTIDGSLTLGEYSMVEFYLSQTGFTQLAVGSIASIDPTTRFKFNLADGYVPSAGASFPVLDWGTTPIVGMDRLGIANWIPYLILPDLGPEFVWATSDFGLLGIIAADGTAPVLAFVADPEDVLALEGEPISFTVAVNGPEPILIQWYKAETAAGPGILIQGANELSYSISSAAGADAGFYFARATNANNLSEIAESDRAVLDVVTTPRIVTDPVGATVFPTVNVTFEVEAIGPGTLTYVWKRNGGAVSEAPDAPVFTLTGITAANAGNYTVEVINANGSITSAAAVLNVLAPIVIDPQPQNVTTPEGNPATFSVVVSGDGPFTYQWRRNGVNLPSEESDTLTVTAATNNSGSQGNYTVLVSNAYASLLSNVATLTLGPVQVIIDDQPEAQIVQSGATLNLFVASSGGKPQTFQWLFKGNAIAGETSDSLSIPNMTLAQAGLYTCRVSNNLASGSSSVLSAPASVAVVDGTNRQFVVNEPGVVSLSVTAAADKSDGLSYLWFLDDGMSIQPVAGATARTFRATGVSAGKKRFFCAVTAAGGTESGGDNVVFVYNQAPALQASAWTLPATTVSEDYYFRVPLDGQTVDAQTGGTGDPVPEKMPVSFRATGLPAGLRIDNQGVISGRATVDGSFPVTITATNARGTTAPVVKILVVAPLSDNVIGEFVGPVDRDLALNGNLGGSISVRTTKKGTYTGRVTLGAKGYSFRGALNPVPGSAGASVVISRGRLLPPMTLTFALDANTGLIDRSLSSLTDGTNTIGFDGWRYVWAPVKGQPPSAAALGGYYTMALSLPAGSPLIGTTANENIPQGNGFASFTVSPMNGRLRVAGRLADGTAFNTATYAGPGGEVMVFRTLYAPNARGSVIGSVKIDDLADSNPDNNTLAGSVNWWRPATPGTTARLYRAGFDPLDLDVVGSRYIPPVATSATPRVLALPATAVGTPNAVVELTQALVEGQLPLFDAANPSLNEVSVRVDERNRALAIGTNPRKVSLTINAKTGAISGRFALEVLTPVRVVRTVSYSGMIVGDGVQPAQGQGYFLLPKLPASALERPTTTSILSGLVIFDKL